MTGMSPLEIAERMRDAIDEDRSGELSILLRAGAYPDESGYRGFTALIVAARLGDLDLMKRALDAGADIDRPDQYGLRPLQHALEQKQAEAARLLLQRGAACDAESLMRRALFDEKLMTLAPDLVDRGAPIDGLHSNNTALAYACIGGKEDMARALLDRGADMEISNANGYTALMFAATNNHFGLTRLLLDRGADLDAVNDAAQTAPQEVETRFHNDRSTDRSAVRNMLADEISRRAAVKAEEAAALARARLDFREKRETTLRGLARRMRLGGPKP